MDSTKKTALQILELTSKTFFIPITRAPSPAKEALISAYLGLRATDEVEDHPTFDRAVKAQILKNIAFTMMEIGPDSNLEDLQVDWLGKEEQLPEVTLRVVEWLFYCPASIRIRMADFYASISQRMALWTERDWKVKNEADLNGYIYAVSVVAGFICADIFRFYYDSKSDYRLLEIFFRGQQGINIFLDREKDLKRGVSFWPPGWTQRQMKQYVNKQLRDEEEYLNSMPEDSAIKNFFQIPHDLAVATMKVREEGQLKLTRKQVLEITKIKTQ